jgi:hypothetical protein
VNFLFNAGGILTMRKIKKTGKLLMLGSVNGSWVAQKLQKMRNGIQTYLNMRRNYQQQAF